MRFFSAWWSFSSSPLACKKSTSQGAATKLHMLSLLASWYRFSSTGHSERKEPIFMLSMRTCSSICYYHPSFSTLGLTCDAKNSSKTLEISPFSASVSPLHASLYFQSWHMSRFNLEWRCSTTTRTRRWWLRFLLCKCYFSRPFSARLTWLLPFRSSHMRPSLNFSLAFSAKVFSTTSSQSSCSIRFNRYSQFSSSGSRPLWSSANSFCLELYRSPWGSSLEPCAVLHSKLSASSPPHPSSKHSWSSHFHFAPTFWLSSLQSTGLKCLELSLF